MAGVAASGGRREIAAERAARLHRMLDVAIDETIGKAGARKGRTLLDCGFAYSIARGSAAASASFRGREFRQRK